MRTEFVHALQEANDQTTIDARIEHIKRAVTHEVKATDPAVTVRFTEYFNNVVVPDMVLRWPEESRERLLYLRPSANLQWLEDDVVSLAPHRPMIFTLEDIDRRRDQEVGRDQAALRLAERATSAETWIAGPSAIEGVAEARKTSPVVGLLGQALIRGGKGVSTGQSVSELTSITVNAFNQARTQVTQPVAESVSSLERSLDEQQAGRLTRILRAVWEGHGGTAAAFPAVSSTGPLSEDDLSYLMITLEDAPREFWRRVGRNITTAQLGRLRLADPSRSLQNFVAANLESLSAKGLRVTSQQVRLGESEDAPRWLIDRGCLAIRGWEWIAHLAARRAEELPPAEEGLPLEFAALRERVADADVLVTRVEFEKGDRAVSYESKVRLDILDDEDLTRVADEVRGMAVERATVSLLGGGAANVEFSTRTALGPTSSTLPVGGLARAALPLLTSPQDDEAAALDAFLAPEQTELRFSGGVADLARGLPGAAEGVLREPSGSAAQVEEVDDIQPPE
jgi:hypothetical protein